MLNCMPGSALLIPRPVTDVLLLVCFFEEYRTLLIKDNQKKVLPDTTRGYMENRVTRELRRSS